MASAMIAPLSDDTLVIGTNDSGRTIHSEFDAPEDTAVIQSVRLQRS